MKPCCANCSHWKDAKKTLAGRTPYFGKCEMGRPFKQGKTYTRKGVKYRYCDFTVRSDRCKDWSEE